MAARKECDNERDKEVGLHSLQNADACLERNNYGRAFAHYLMVLKLLPSKKSEIKESFSLALREWGEQLEKQGRIEDLFKCYEQACELFPECETMLNNMGAQLFRLGYVDEAACFLRRSLKLDPDYLGARENLENVCGHLVERWHFRMLNDRVRNEAYRGAITAAVRAGYDTVLDIGTGTGLLSMFAAEAGAKSIYGCDMSKTMYEMSCDVILTNQMADQINLIHSKSTDLKIPEQIPEKVSLVVTEVFDAGLLGEGVIATMYHAWKNLLQPRPLARVIPKGATLFICAVESEHIRSHNRFLYPGLQHLDFKDINLVCKTSHNHIYGDFEPYTSEWLDRLPGGCKLLTLPVPFIDIDLSDPQSMEKYIVGFSQEFSLTVSVNGRLDAVITWFDLHLDADHSVTSSPGSGSCWEQGVYPILPSQLNSDQTDNLLVRQNDRITVKCFYGSDSLKFKCTKVLRNHQTSQDTSSSNKNNNLKNIATTATSATAIFSPLLSRDLSFSAIKTTPVSMPTVTGHSNVLVEPIQQSYSFYNGNYGELEFGCGIQDVVRMRHASSDSIEEHAHLESQCIEIIESVMHGESSPTQQSYLNGNIQPPSYTNITVGSGANITTPSNGAPLFGNSLKTDNANNLDDTDISLASASIQNLSFGSKSNLSSTSSSSVSSDSGNQFTTVDNSEVNTQTFYLNRDDLWKLNDLNYNRSMCTALQHVKSKLRPPNPFKVITIPSSVPILGLQALKLGASEVCILDSDVHQPLLHAIAAVNDIPNNKLIFASTEDMEIIEGQWGAMIAELVDEGGCMQQRILEDIALARATCLSPKALVIPGKVTIQAMMIESQSLRTDSMITSDSNTLGYLVAGFMNDFQMTTHAGINLSVLEHKALTQPFELLTFDLNEFNLGQVPSYLDQSSSTSVKAVETGTIHAILYWFDFELTSKVKISTLDSKFNFKQAAILQKTPLTVSTGSPLRVRSMCRNSCVHAELRLS